jgi:hypothetical protein
VDAAGDTGESEPAVAIQDALATFAADRIVVFSHPEGDRDYREDEGLADAEERFGVPAPAAVDVRWHRVNTGARRDGPVSSHLSTQRYQNFRSTTPVSGFRRCAGTLDSSSDGKLGYRTEGTRQSATSLVGFRTMSLISEGQTGRAQASAPTPPTTGERPTRPGTRTPSNAVRASQARAALRREARRDEQAVQNWLRQLARPSR